MIVFWWGFNKVTAGHTTQGRDASVIAIEIFNGEEGHSRWVAVLLVFVRADGGDQTAFRAKATTKNAA